MQNQSRPEPTSKVSDYYEEVRKLSGALPGMPSRPCGPRSHSVVGTNKIIARVNSIVTICSASDELPVDKRTAVATLVMRT